MAIAEVSVVPVGTASSSLSKHIARAVRVLQVEQGVKYEITPMGTIIEGDLDRLFALARRMHEETFGEGVVRVLTTIKIDDRRDKRVTFRDKVDSLKRELES